MKTGHGQPIILHINMETSYFSQRPCSFKIDGHIFCPAILVRLEHQTQGQDGERSDLMGICVERLDADGPHYWGFSSFFVQDVLRCFTKGV